MVMMTVYVAMTIQAIQEKLSSYARVQANATKNIYGKKQREECLQDPAYFAGSKTIFNNEGMLS